MERGEVETVLRDPAGGLVQPRLDTAREVVVIGLQCALRSGARRGDVEVQSVREEQAEQEDEDGERDEGGDE